MLKTLKTNLKITPKHSFMLNKYKMILQTNKLLRITVDSMKDDPNDLAIYEKACFPKESTKGFEYFFKTIKKVTADLKKSKYKTPLFIAVPEETFFVNGRKQIPREDLHVKIEIYSRERFIDLSYEDWRELKFKIEEMFLLQKGEIEAH